MKTFEEKWTAWVDGELAGSELAEFEAELAKSHDAEAGKNATRQLGELLRAHGRAPALTNQDFFNHQLIERIRSENPRRADAPEKAPAFAWPLARMAWAGAFCLLIALGLYFFAIPSATRQNPLEPEYLARVLEARAADPSISATAYHSGENNVTVLWLDGLDYLPADYQLQ